MADHQKTVIATTVIHRATKPGTRGDKAKGIAPTKPEIQVIKPGARFIPKDATEFSELMKAGAIKLPGEPAATVAEAEIEKAAAEADAPKKARKSGKRAAKKTDDGGGGDGSDLV